MSAQGLGPRVTWTPPGAAQMSTLVKRRGLILGGALVGFVAGMMALLLLPSRYEVSASLLFKLARETKPAVATGTVPNPLPQGLRPEDVASEIEILRSQYLLERLVQHFGEEFFFVEPAPRTTVQRLTAAGRRIVTGVTDAAREVLIAAGLSRRLTRAEQALLMLQRSFVIEPVSRADVIRVRCVMSDAEAGVRLVDRFIDLYFEQHIVAHTTPKARSFLEGQADSLRQLLADAEKARARYKKAQSVWALDEQRKLLLNRRRDMGAARDATRSEAAQLGAEVTGIQGKLTAVPSELRQSTTQARNPLIDTLRTRLLQLEGRRAELRARYADDSRVVADLEREIEEVRRALRSEETYVTQTVTSGVNATAQAIERELITKQATLDGLLARAAEQTHQLAALDAQIRAVDAAEVEMRRLEREVTLLEQNYVLYARNLEEARISEALDQAKISNISVIAPPRASIRPVWPPKLLLVGGSLLWGLGSAIALAFVSEALRPTVRTRGDVTEILGVPVLASIPEPRAYDRRI